VTTETETQEQTSQEDQAAQSAAFEASFNDKPMPTPAPTEAPKPADQATETPAASPAPTPAPTAAPKAEDQELRAQLRNLHGHVGALKDELAQLKKAKDEAGKPATLTPVELKRMKAEFPEMSQFLQEDMAEVLATLAPKAPDPKEIQSLVQQGVQAEVAKFREETVTDRHATWKTDLWTDKPGGQRSAEYQAWLKTMPDAEAQAFESSQSPAFVIRKLDQFYDWKNKAAKAETEKQARLKAAVSPTQGTPKPGSTAMSEEEAQRKAFEDAFNS
jgi:hypothetical protein